MRRWGLCPLICGFQGAYLDKYADPAPALRAMEVYRKDFLKARSSGDLVGMQRGAMGHWVNALVTGRGAEAKRCMMKNAPPDVRSWLLEYDEEILKSVSALRRSYSRTLPPER